ncbi:hypothetical protein H6F32_12815 [Anabaena sp. FACHB-1237]|uniref:hypothetical protein n=1 Tax=Anabaena sp. FACHB-1237 TaxID=2692769 RepID=UPI00168190B9|nr:hypothetical protein [Anabaena sp. FACHB-1237]MBD2138450.1 hypothetical protein [Anabaena sp. FACHB-1237]
MLTQFQKLYPNGSIISELIQIFQGKYIVRVSINVEGITRATAMSAADTIETAEDQARNRALMVLGIKEIPETTTPLPISQPVHIPSHQLDDPSNYPSNYPSHHPSHHPSNASNVSDNYTPSVTPVMWEHPENLPTVKPEAVTSDILPFPEPEYQPPSNVTPFTPRSYTPVEDISESSIAKRTKKIQPINLSDVIAQTDVEIERLGWSAEQGKEHLIKTYGKRGRSLLSEEELRDFLIYLKSQPDPIAGF